MVKTFNIRAARLEHLHEMQQFVARAQKGSKPPASKNNNSTVSSQQVSSSSSSSGNQRSSSKKELKKRSRRQYAEIPDYGIFELFEQAEEFRILSSKSKSASAASAAPNTSSSSNNKNHQKQTKTLSSIRSYGIAEMFSEADQHALKSRSPPPSSSQKQLQASSSSSSAKSLQKSNNKKVVVDSIEDVPNLGILFNSICENKKNVMQSRSGNQSVIGKLFQSNDELIAQKISSCSSSSSSSSQNKGIQVNHDIKQKKNISALFSEWSVSEINSPSTQKSMRSLNSQNNCLDSDHINREDGYENSEHQMKSWNGSERRHFSRKSIENALRERIEFAQILRLSFDSMHKRLEDGHWNTCSSSHTEEWRNAENAFIPGIQNINNMKYSGNHSTVDCVENQHLDTCWDPDHRVEIDNISNSKWNQFNSNHSEMNLFESQNCRFSCIYDQDINIKATCGIDSTCYITYTVQESLNSWMDNQHEEIEPFVWKLKHVDPPPFL